MFLPTMTPKTELKQINSRERRYKIGQFFAPEPIAELMGYAVREVKPATVLDPAVGAAFRFAPSERAQSSLVSTSTQRPWSFRPHRYPAITRSRWTTSSTRNAGRSPKLPSTQQSENQTGVIFAWARFAELEAGVNARRLVNEQWFELVSIRTGSMGPTYTSGPEFWPQTGPTFRSTAPHGVWQPLFSPIVSLGNSPKHAPRPWASMLEQGRSLQSGSRSAAKVCT